MDVPAVPERRTNMRLCDLDEIKVCVARQYENCHGYSGSKKAIYREAILAVKSILHSAKPIADVAPVRHGRWIEREKYTFGTMYDCSICDNRILDNGHSWNYCPNCGAKMDGGAD